MTHSFEKRWERSACHLMTKSPGSGLCGVRMRPLMLPAAAHFLAQAFIDFSPVVGGFSPGNPFDGILMGYFEGGQLLFAAIVRAGFTPALDTLQAHEALARRNVPVANLRSRKSGEWNESVTAEDMAKMTCVRPEVVMHIAFVEWTTYDLLRHASFLGLRGDKSAKEVRREV